MHLLVFFVSRGIFYFLFFKNSWSDVDERGHRLPFMHTRRRGIVESFSIHTHEVSGSTPVVQVTVFLSGRVIPVFFSWGGRGASYLFWREITQVWVTTLQIRKNYVFYFLSKFLIGQVFSQSNPFTQHSRIFYKMKFIYL